MSEGTQLSRLPRLVTPRKLAYADISVEGYVSASDLQILSEAVDSIGDVAASLAFTLNGEGKLVVSGWIEANISHQCQRCMQPIPHCCERVEVCVGIVRNEDEAKQLPRSLDPWVVSEDEADLYSYIEEELLLALPVVAYHDDSCIDVSLLSSGEQIEEEVEDKVSPFSVLSSLKLNGKADGE